MFWLNKLFRFIRYYYQSRIYFLYIHKAVLALHLKFSEETKCKLFKAIFCNYKFDVRKSVHHHTIQII
jgi:hypothetical protein